MMATTAAAPPRKYEDADRTIVTPEWLEWRDAQTGSPDAIAILESVGVDPEMYYPVRGGKGIPEDGAWILVVEEPNTELRSRFRVPFLSMWRTRPHQMSRGGVRLGARGPKVYPKQAVITTPGGDLHLWPREYVVAHSAREPVGCEGAELHRLGGAPVLDEEQVFYLQSRGIHRSDAVLMLFDQIDSTDFVYVTFPDDVTEGAPAIAEGGPRRGSSRGRSGPRCRKPGHDEHSAQRAEQADALVVVAGLPGGHTHGGPRRRPGLRPARLGGTDLRGIPRRRPGHGALLQLGHAARDKIAATAPPRHVILGLPGRSLP